MRKKVVKASQGPKEKAFTCPKCHNNTLYDLSESVTRVADVDHGDQFICDECGAEFYAEPQHDGTIQFKTKKPKGRQTYKEINAAKAEPKTSINAWYVGEPSDWSSNGHSYWDDPEDWKEKSDTVKQLVDSNYPNIQLDGTSKWGIGICDDHNNWLYRFDFWEDDKSFEAQLKEFFTICSKRGIDITASTYLEDDNYDSIEAALVDTPQSVVDELIEILGKYGFVLDPAFASRNPGRTWMDNVHLQVINEESYVNEYRDNSQNALRKYVPHAMIDAIHELEERTNCPITYNFGANNAGQVTGGLDILKQYVPDDVGASTEIKSATDKIIIPEPYNKYFKVDRSTPPDDDFHRGDEIPDYDAKFIAWLVPKARYEGLIDTWPMLTDDPDYPVCELVGGRLIPVSVPGAVDSSCKVEGANYGGAYDIDPEMFFTKEDIMEFGNAVCEKLTEKFDKPFDIADTYIELPQKLSLFVSDPDWNEYSCSVPLDMRRIKIPADLTRKYLDTFVDSLSADIEKDAEIYSATTLPEGQIRRKAKDLHDELLETAADLLQSADFGFDLSDVADMLTIDVQTPRQLNDPIRVELRCELSYTGMRKLEDALDPIVQQYDADAYFDDVEPGIAEAFIRV